MPRRGPFFAVKTAPWALALELAMVANAHWQELKDSERRRLGELIRKSKGNPRALNQRERDELRKIAAKLDFPGMARDLVPFARRFRRR